jgi:SAM-dependent methyltransferase
MERLASDLEILAALEASGEQWQFRSRVGSHQYLRLYELTRRYIAPGSSVLDWGAASGHFSYFLTLSGYRATGFSLYSDRIPAALRGAGYRLVVGDPSDPVTLPFSDSSFDAVASIGVLEHVRETGGDEGASLREVRRVLRSSGVFLCFHLPNRYSWIDAAVRVTRISSGHRFRYTTRDIGRLARGAGLELLDVGRYALLPRNPLHTLLPARVAESESFARFYDAADAGLGRLVPWICTNHYFVARAP